MPRCKVGELLVGDRNDVLKRFDSMAITEDIEKLDGHLIECVYLDGQWVIIKQRIDKKGPNFISTANGRSKRSRVLNLFLN